MTQATDVTPEAIWMKLNEDQEFQAQPEAVRKVTQPFIEALPTILANQLDLPVTLNNLTQAKFDWMNYCLKNGYIEACMAVMPDEAFNFYSREEMPDVMKELLEQALEMATGLIGHVEELLEEYGVTEDQILLQPKNGFNAEIRERYLAHTLTIGDVLLIQPAIITKNS